MVEPRLNYYLEYNCLIHSFQTGFRKQKSTTDILIKRTNEFEKKKVSYERSKVLYIEKAYDTMWMVGLLMKLVKICINGRMYNVLSAYLEG